MESFERIAKKVEKYNSNKKKPTNNIGFNRFIGGISSIFSGVITGIVFGFLLDSIFKTKFILMLIFMLFGFIGAIINIYKQIKES